YRRVQAGVANLACYFFFFQAEDGIRDYKVTGVQTCALPIWRRGVPVHAGGVWRKGRADGEDLVAAGRRQGALSDVGSAGSGPGRSEERRVGKEWRARLAGWQ